METVVHVRGPLGVGPYFMGKVDLRARRVPLRPRAVWVPDRRRRGSDGVGPGASNVPFFGLAYSVPAEPIERGIAFFVVT